MLALTRAAQNKHRAFPRGRAEWRSSQPSLPGPEKPTGRARPRATHPPTTVRTSFSMSALMYIRPRRSVWSVPHKLGTFITQRLCTFIVQAAERRKGLLSTSCRPATAHRGVGGGLGGRTPLPLSEDVCEGLGDKHAANGPPNPAGDLGLQQSTAQRRGPTSIPGSRLQTAGLLALALITQEFY